MVVKKESEGAARELFRETAISIISTGRRHLESALGEDSFVEALVASQVERWCMGGSRVRSVRSGTWSTVPFFNFINRV